MWRQDERKGAILVGVNHRVEADPVLVENRQQREPVGRIVCGGIVETSSLKKTEVQLAQLEVPLDRTTIEPRIPDAA